ESLNIKSATIHLFWDAMASLAVIIGGILILFYDLFIVDPILTIAIALYIMYTSYGLLKQTLSILMEATPSDIDVNAIKKELEQIRIVQDVHHIHVWKMDEHETMMECHVLIPESDSSSLESIKSEIKQRLSDSFGITHSAIEFELQPCEEPAHE
ncbi:MAG TPA: cation diffusion facilitator family transporter, partial [Balneolaceae bacterium]|nr:cation diffusion facilitator family transporter [Balneolaceae bacterium]